MDTATDTFVADDVSASPPQSSGMTMNLSPRQWARDSIDDRTLPVSKAEKIIRFYTDNPSWLADPRTSHAANAVFGAASRVIGMNLQLERVSAQAEAAKAKASMSRQVGTSLLKLAEAGPDGAKIASKWYAQGDDGKQLFENPANWKAILDDYQAYEKPEKPLGAIGKDLHDELAFYRSGGTKDQWNEAIKAHAGSRGEYVGPYVEPTIKDIGGKSFMFYRNFSPKPLDRLTPQQQQMLNVNVAGLKEARKKLTDATDDATREDAQKVYNRELATFNEFFDMVSPRAAATPGTNSPATTAPTNPAAQKADEANKIASENPGWTRQQIIDEVNKRFAR